MTTSHVASNVDSVNRAGILYRDFDMDPDEREAIRKHFGEHPDTFFTNSRLDILMGDVVVGRYAVLPFYLEQQRDIDRIGAHLVNSYGQHNYIAEMHWAEDLEGLTPTVWRGLNEIPDNYKGAFVLKGVTNSRKHRWDTHMFALDRTAASEVYCRLLDDSLIGQQEIVIRPYVPLKRYTTGVGGVPITKEFRVFVLDGKILAKGYYWASHWEDVKDLCLCGHAKGRHRNHVPAPCTAANCGCVNYKLGAPDPSAIPRDWLDDVVGRVHDKCPFFVVDVAETAVGDWIVVELNDGQQSGLSMCAPDELYKNMAKVLKERK